MNGTTADIVCRFMQIDCDLGCKSLTHDCIRFADYVQMGTTPLSIALFTLSGISIIHGGKRGVQLIRKIAYRYLFYKRIDPYDQLIREEPIGKMKLCGKTIKVTKTFATASIPLIVGGIIYLLPSLIRDVACPKMASVCVTVCTNLSEICNVIELIGIQRFG